MSGSQRALFGTLIVMLLVGISFAVFWSGEKEQPLAVKAPDAQHDPKQQPMVDVGGVKRPASDLAKNEPSDTEKKSEERGYGVAPSVPEDLNPQVRSVAEAIRTKSHPERVSVMMKPSAFDAKAYGADPTAYLNIVEPGRVFQTAQPGKGVKRIAPLSPYFQRVAQGQSIALKVKAPAGAPVTFTSFDMGEFANRLTSITVAADNKGVAQTQFFGTPGTIANVNILAGSPVAAGQVKFVAHVVLPDLAANE
jgi:hypothetical protein